MLQAACDRATVVLATALPKSVMKCLFVLRAAADGWRVRYVGPNTFEFLGKARKRSPSVTQFVAKYSRPAPCVVAAPTVKRPKNFRHQRAGD